MRCFLVYILLLASFLGMGQAIEFGNLGNGFNNAIYSPVRALFYDSLDKKLYAGGQFAIADGKTVWGAAVWQNNSWDSLAGGLTQYPQLTPNSASMGPVVYKITRFQNKIYYVGGIEWVNGKNQYFMGVWNGTTWDYPIAQPPNGEVWDLKVYNGTLYACGLFTKFGNTTCNYVAKFDGISWQPVGDFSQYYKAPDTPAHMYAIAMYNNEIYVGGLFSDTSGTIRDIAKFDGTNWVNVGPGIQQGGISWVQSLETFNNKLYIAGYFSRTQDVPGEALIALNGNAFEDVGADLLKGTFKTLYRSKNKLFVVSNFYGSNGSYFPGIKYIEPGKVCLIDGLLSTFTNTLNYSVECMESINDSLIVGGQFLYLDTVSANNVGVITNYENNTDCIYVGLKENNLDDYSFEVFPNPTNDLININYTSVSSIPLEISLMNTFGQLVYRTEMAGSKKEISLKSMAAGIYYLKIQDDTAMKVFKIVKQ